MTIAGIEKVFTENLKGLYGTDEAASIAWLVIGFVCKIDRSQYLSNKYKDLGEKELQTFYTILTELKRAVPVQYVLGETEFYGSLFKVDASVLIPRPETEELVDWILKDIKAQQYPNEPLSILDIGTGSGCIPITLKKYLGNTSVSATDISKPALEKARENALLNQTQVNFIQDDILNPGMNGEPFTIVVSNPPYVTVSEKAQMHPNVIQYEPHDALFVPDEDPLIFYSAIADFTLLNLRPEGALYLEINENLGAQTISLLENKGFRKIELRQDLRDVDRMIKAQFN